MTATKKPVERVTVEEYLRAERAASERHVYLDGRVWAMAGESLSHGRVCTNLTGMFYLQLLGKRCEPLSKDTKVRSGPAGPWPTRSTKGLYSYPDVVVVCGEPEFLDERQDVLTNPTVIVEVLSPSTEAFDRGAKFERLRLWNSTLTDYILVSQDRPLVEHFTRLPDESWRMTEHRRSDAARIVGGIGVRLPLAEVYGRVQFPPDDDPADAGG
jgi:Uma2 family endonuclease